jgi:putative ABC transport system permease protein
MVWMRQLWIRLQTLCRRNRASERLDDEMQFHLEQQVAENIAAGMSPEEARYAAMRAFGNPTVLKEETRDTWGWIWFEQIVQDVRYAARMLRKSPGFTAVAVFTLALGIGANTAIFSVIDRVLLAPLGYPHAERLVELELTFGQSIQRAVAVSHFNVWRQQRNVFEAVAAYDFSGPGINLTGNGLPEQLKGIRASASYFDVYGVSMALGRAYTAQEDVPNGPNVVVISNALWRGRFGGDPNIVGRTRGTPPDPCCSDRAAGEATMGACSTTKIAARVGEW